MRKFLLTVFILVSITGDVCLASEEDSFNPDQDNSRVHWTKLDELLGPAPDVKGKTFGIVIKTPVNEYWRQMASGFRRRGTADGVKLDIQAAPNEDDPLRQLSIMQSMLGNRYSALLISPMSSSNLKPAIDDALGAGIPLVNIDGAIAEDVAPFVGPNNYQMGARVAQWFVNMFPSGGKLAVIKGQQGVFSTVQRSAGFSEALSSAEKFQVVATVYADWDSKKAFDAAISILKMNEDLIGIYCNNDTMALAVVDAVKSLGMLKTVHVFGSDGTGSAFKSIRAGELTGTIDIFPSLIGEIGLEVAERVSEGQNVPRVVETPLVLITSENVEQLSADNKGLRDALMDAENK